MTLKLLARCLVPCTFFFHFHFLKLFLGGISLKVKNIQGNISFVIKILITFLKEKGKQ